MIDLSIVIVSYNARADLERCLGSILQNPPPDDARDHRRGQRVERRQRGRGCGLRNRTGHRVRHGTAGFAAANNVGIRASAEVRSCCS